MQTQKFIAANMKDGLQQVREALGDDAIILRSERVKPAGVLSFAKQNMIEITAAPNGYAAEDLVNGPEFAKSLDQATAKTSNSIISQPVGGEIDRLRGEVTRLTSQMDEIGKYFKYNNLPVMPRNLTAVWEGMSNSGMNTEWATDLAQEALIALTQDELNSADQVEQFLLNQVAVCVRPAPLMKARRKSAVKIMLVGLPGSGKTTLLQKMASDPTAYAKRRIGLISFDTHRVAAIDQLRAYSRICGAQLEIVYRADQVAEAMHRLSSAEIILIDTAGISPHDITRIHELRQIIDAVDPDETHHVMNSMLRVEELTFACMALRELGITHLSFTRLDEAQRLGFLLNVARLAEKPLGWLTNGQAFVGNLERFTPAHLKSWTRANHLNSPTDDKAHVLMRMD